MGIACQCADPTGNSRKDPKKKKMFIDQKSQSNENGIDIFNNPNILVYCGQRKAPKRSYGTHTSDSYLNISNNLLGNPFLDGEDEQLQHIIDNQNIDDLDIKSPQFQQFRQYYRKQFSSKEEYQKQLKVLQSRPELIPHYLIQYKKTMAQKKLQRLQ